MAQHLIKLARCPECGSPHIVKDKDMGEFVCSECGLVVLGDMLNQGPEWRAFTLEEKRAKRRTGSPTDYTYFDKGLSTTMWMKRDAFGRPLPAKTRRQMWRLRKWQIRAQLHDKGLNLMRAMDEIQRLSEKLYIPSSVQEMAAIFYRKALDKNLVRGRSIVSIAAAALYVACRFMETPKSLEEIVEVSLRDRKDISRCYRMLVRRLNIKMPIHDPLNYLPKVAEKAGIPGDVQGLAVRILREARRKHVTVGKDPRGIVAAVLYIACLLKDKKVTQKDVAAAANVTEVTVRNRKKDLVEKLHLDV